MYSALAAAILGLHLLFILWIIFGATVTWRRPLLRWLHLTSLVSRRPGLSEHSARLAHRHWSRGLYH